LVSNLEGGDDCDRATWPGERHPIRLVSVRQIGEKPRTGRPGGRGKRRQLSELRGQLDSVSWRLSALEHRVGTAPDLAQLDGEIAQIRRDRESAIDAQDFENAAVLRDREQRLADDKAARLREWAALPSLSDEVERLRDLLRRHGIDPRDGVAWPDFARLVGHGFADRDRRFDGGDLGAAPQSPIRRSCRSAQKSQDRLVTILAGCTRPMGSVIRR
jgi:hypothetical protein